MKTLAEIDTVIQTTELQLHMIDTILEFLDAFSA